ncbi:MAG: ATP-binding protein [bacterium]
MLRDVFYNLMKNASEAFKEREGMGNVRVKINKPADFVEIRVIDDGPGISKEDIPKIFEPFFITKEKIGTGLGLSICKAIIEEHKGTIEVESMPKMTSFIINLPVC